MSCTDLQLFYALIPVQAASRKHSCIVMAVSTTLVLPGDEISRSALPTGTGKKKTLTLGPGLRHVPPNTVVTSIAGTLVTDNKKNAALVEYNSGRVSSDMILLLFECAC